MKKGTIAAAFAAGLSLGVALPLAGEELLYTLRQGAQGVTPGNYAILFCTRTNGSIIPGSTPTQVLFNGNVGGVTAWAAHVSCP